MFGEIFGTGSLIINYLKKFYFWKTGVEEEILPSRRWPRAWIGLKFLDFFGYFLW
jgi:hypothetical protein